MTEMSKENWGAGDPYELYVGRWSREIAWHFVVSVAKQNSVAWTPPTQGPQTPFSVHFWVPSKQPGTPRYDGTSAVFATVAAGESCADGTSVAV